MYLGVGTTYDLSFHIPFNVYREVSLRFLEGNLKNYSILELFLKSDLLPNVVLSDKYEPLFLMSRCSHPLNAPVMNQVPFPKQQSCRIIAQR